MPNPLEIADDNFGQEVLMKNLQIKIGVPMYSQTHTQRKEGAIPGGHCLPCPWLPRNHMCLSDKL